MNGPTRKQHIALATLSALAVSLGVSLTTAGCGGSDESAAAKPPKADPVATETGPKPMTKAERAWWRSLDRYVALFAREAFRDGQVTHASLRHDAKLARKCRTTLVRHAHPGRFRPAFETVRRACNRLDKAAGLFEVAIAASGPGGIVVDGTSDAIRFQKALNRSSEAMGNAQYNLDDARDEADEIASGLPKD